ncbi:hypothetical protein CsSME_00003508 [Camellia sinensis var. sinensis]
MLILALLPPSKLAASDVVLSHTGFWKGSFCLDVPLVLFTWLLSSCTSLPILRISYVLEATNENLPPNVIKQLAKELKNLDETPPVGIKVGVNDDDFSIIYADIEGPDWPNINLAAGTPYENGVFRMKLILSHDFPHSPPKVYRVDLYIVFASPSPSVTGGRMVSLSPSPSDLEKHGQLCQLISWLLSD